jgi:hypothetical protein
MQVIGNPTLRIKRKEIKICIMAQNFEDINIYNR